MQYRRRIGGVMGKKDARCYLFFLLATRQPPATRSGQS
jgi:hypothetical protein